MRTASRRGASFATSVGLHLLLLGLLSLTFHTTTQLSASSPVGVELWSAPPMARVSQPDTPVAPAPKPAPAPEDAKPEPLPPVAKPDIALEEKKPHPKPEKKPEPKPEKKPEPEKKPAHPQSKAAPDKAPSKKARSGDFDVDDALADLGSSNTKIKPNSNRTQAGSPGGVAGGSATGSGKGSGGGGSTSGYASLVVSRVRPLVQVPDQLTGNPKALVQVTLLPTLEVRDVKLLQSSGNAGYDEAVQRAVWQAKTFPPLPAGISFSDIRVLKLEFRPRA